MNASPDETALQKNMEDKRTRQEIAKGSIAKPALPETADLPLAELALRYGVNEEQAAALNFRENTALRAGAGSGKTRVLTKRYVRILREAPQAELRDIVAITFTRKAAAEMRDRVRREIGGMLEQDAPDEFPMPAPMRERLERARLGMADARIDTIHGFLGQLLRDHFELSGLDPAFEILEAADAILRIRQHLTDAVREVFEDDVLDAHTRMFLAAYGAGSLEDALPEAILHLYEAIRTSGSTLAEVCALHAAQPVLQTPENIPVHALETLGLQILTRMEAAYETGKRRDNVLDFSDLETLSLQLLSDADTRRRIRGTFRWMMLDEFQDVNPLQMRILKHLAMEEDGWPASGRLFVVGDAKQSIYGFRGADARVFEEMCGLIAHNGHVRHLSNCYRSTETLIATVNRIFKPLMETYIPLRLPRPKSGPVVDLHVWTGDDVKARKSPTRWAAVKDLLSMNDPERLDTLLRAPYPEAVAAGKSRYQGERMASVLLSLAREGAAWRDMAILLPSRTPLPAIEDGLREHDIPYCVLGGLGFWSRLEVTDILHLYRLVFRPQDRLAFFAVLRSPIFSFSDDLLLRLRVTEREAIVKAESKPGPETRCGAFPDTERGAIRDNACKQGPGADYAQMPVISPTALLSDLLADPKLPESEAALVRHALTVLIHLFRLEGLLDATGLFDEMLRATDYPGLLRALPDGARKFRNLEKLQRLVDRFAANPAHTARELPEWLASLEASGSMDADAFLDSEDSEAVKILTIHAAKGLEFPIVLLPSMDRITDAIGVRNKPLLLTHPERGVVGLGLDGDGGLSIQANSAYAEQYEQRRLSELAESVRVFYVAATRAETRLVMLGADQDVKKDDGLMQRSFMRLLRIALGDEVDRILHVVKETSEAARMVENDPPVEEVNAAETESADADAEASIEADVAEAGPAEADTEASIEADVAEAGPAEADTESLGETKAAEALPAYQLETQPAGIVSISQWMQWRDCPRQYWFSRVLRLPPDMPGAEDGEAYETYEAGQAGRTGQEDQVGQEGEAVLVETGGVMASDAVLEDEGQSVLSPLPASYADPDLTVDAARLGTWIHGVLQKLAPIRLSERLIHPEVKPEEVLLPPWITETTDLTAHALHLLDGYNHIQHHNNRQEELLASWNEFEFRCMLSHRCELFGIVDRLDVVQTPSDIGIVLVDYKTNRLHSEEALHKKEAYYAAQLKTYAWAVARLPLWQGENLPVLRAELHFLDRRMAVEVPVTPAECGEAVRQVLDSLSFLNGQPDASLYPRKEGDVCTWCRQQAICKVLATTSSG